MLSLSQLNKIKSNLKTTTPIDPRVSAPEPEEPEIDPCNLDQTPISASEQCNMLATAEGSGKYDQGGEQYGRYQFTKSTGVGVLTQLGHSDPTDVWNECSNSASERCKGIQDDMCNHYSAELSRSLTNRDIPVTTENLYLAWNQGAGGASVILRSVASGEPITNPEVLSNMHGQAWNFSTDGRTYYSNMRGYLQKKGVALS